MIEKSIVPSDDLDFILKHLQNINLHRPGVTSEVTPDQTFTSNEQFWKKFLKEVPSAFRWVKLNHFQLVDWFPRTPGLYHTPGAERGRREAEHYVREENGVLFYEPTGKGCMIMDGGIGSVRFKPIPIEGNECWLCTATSDGYCHTGVPLAVPDTLLEQIGYRYYHHFNIAGQVKFLPKFLEEDFYHMERLPQIYVLVDKIEPSQPKRSKYKPVMISPMVFFTVGSGLEVTSSHVTYVTCQSDSMSELDEACDWITQYVNRYGDKIITNFDQQRPAFRDVPFSLQNVMDGKLDKQWVDKLCSLESRSVIKAFEKITAEKVYIGEIRMGDTFYMSGDFRGAILNIKSTLTNVSQKIDGIPNADRSTKNELNSLIVQLNEVLQQTPQEKADEAQAVAESTKLLVEQASAKKPNKTMLQIAGEGLKRAAESIADALPSALSIATQIVTIIANLTG